MTWFAVAAAAAAVAGAAISGYSSYTANKTASQQAEADAEAAKGQGRVEAERIRKQKERVQSAARAAAAENGLDVNEGVAIVVNDQIESDGNYDAEMAKVNGFNQSQRLLAESSIFKNNANAAAAAGIVNTGSAITSFKANQNANNKNKGWK